MGIAHGHDQAGMPEYFLQGEDVAPVLYELAGKGMAKGMTSLTTGELYGCFGQGSSKRAYAISKLAMALPVIKQKSMKARRHRNRPDLAAFGAAKGDKATSHR